MGISQYRRLLGNGYAVSLRRLPYPDNLDTHYKIETLNKRQSWNKGISNRTVIRLLGKQPEALPEREWIQRCV